MNSLPATPRRSSVVRWIACGLLLATPLCADVATGFKEKKKDRKDDKKRDTAYLPEAHPATVRFVAGQSMTVELVAAVSSLKTVEFVIRQAPQHGQLSTVMPHPTDSSKAMVTYTHSSPEAPLADSFTFSCRIAGESWSAPATVALVGQRMEPRLEIVEGPSFGRILLGEERVGRVQVRNRGTAPLQAKLSWPESWSGPPTLDVPLGGVTEFYVKFQPKNPGEYRQDVVLQPGVPTSRVFLHGDCVLPFSITPSKTELTYDGKTGERSATFSVVNARPTAVKAELALPAGLQGPTSVEIAPLAKTDVRVWIPQGEVAAFSGKIAVTAGPSSATVTLDARPVPASMVLASPGTTSLDFGQVYQKEPNAREIVLSNPGGEVLVMEARADTPFYFDDAQRTVRIEPQQTRAFTVALRPKRTGVHTSQAEFVCGTSRIKVALRADVLDSRPPPPPPAPLATESPGTAAPVPVGNTVLASLSPQSAPPIPAPSLPQPAAAPQVPAPVQAADAGSASELTLPHRTSAQLALLTILASKGVPPHQSTINPHLDPVKEVSLVERNSSNVTIAWKKPVVMPSGWVIEFADLVYQKDVGAFVKIWKTYPHWQAVDAGSDEVGARLNGLRPAGQYDMRILGVDREGKFSTPSDVITLQTSDAWQVPGWVWRLTVVGALGLIAYVLFRVRRGDFLVEA